MAVEVGLVVGRMAATTPMGTAEFDDLFVGQLAQKADGFHAAHAAGQEVGREQIFDVLVFGVAVARLFDGELGEMAGVGAGGGGHALDDRVDLFL